MAIFNCYVSSPEGITTISQNIPMIIGEIPVILHFFRSPLVICYSSPMEAMALIEIDDVPSEQDTPIRTVGIHGELLVMS